MRQEVRRRIAVKTPQPNPQVQTGKESIPNQALSRPSDGSARADLGDIMKQRIQQQFLDHQIPAAEQEADHLAAGAAGVQTMAQVKTQMGEKMGADFSPVQFHTGPAAAAVAKQMGARAYTSGKDVYFGEGGFDPAVAAHELVHTAQQGAVASGVETISAPAGEVQMKPKKSKSNASALKQLADGIWIQDEANQEETGVKAKLMKGFNTVADKVSWGTLQAGNAIDKKKAERKENKSAREKWKNEIAKLEGKDIHGKPYGDFHESAGKHIKNLVSRGTAKAKRKYKDFKNDFYKAEDDILVNKDNGKWNDLSLKDKAKHIVAHPLAHLATHAVKHDKLDKWKEKKSSKITKHKDKQNTLFAHIQNIQNKEGKLTPEEELLKSLNLEKLGFGRNGAQNQTNTGAAAAAASTNTTANNTASAAGAGGNQPTAEELEEAKEGQRDARGDIADDSMEESTGLLGFAGTPIEQTGSMLEHFTDEEHSKRFGLTNNEVLEKKGKALSATANVMGGTSDLIEVAQNVKAAKKAKDNGESDADVTASSMDAVSSLASSASNFVALGGEPAEKAGKVFSIGSGAVKMASGGVQIYDAQKRKHDLEELAGQGKGGSFQNLMVQMHRQAKTDTLQGTRKVAGGVFDTATGVADLAGAPTGVGLATKVVGKGVDYGMKKAVEHSYKKGQQLVANQEFKQMHGHSLDDIVNAIVKTQCSEAEWKKMTASERKKKTDSIQKSILRAQGDNEEGSREKFALKATVKRSEEMAEALNDSNSSDNESAQALANAIHIKAGKDGKYSAKTISKKALSIDGKSSQELLEDLELKNSGSEIGSISDKKKEKEEKLRKYADMHPGGKTDMYLKAHGAAKKADRFVGKVLHAVSDAAMGSPKRIYDAVNKRKKGSVANNPVI